MGGQFINTTYGDTINTLVSGLKDILNNPYYMWSGKPPTPVEYIRINKEASSLDQSSGLNYSDVGNESPLWYDIIYDFYLYGIEQIQIQIENGEFGAQAGVISGEGVVLPNTIIPFPGDYFVISYIKERYLFKVMDVTHDTLDNGSNIYKISYELYNYTIEDIIQNIKYRYHFIIGNVGTELACIVRDEKYYLLSALDNIISELQTQYKSYFYNSRVQTFTFLKYGDYYYDKYLIEFLIKHKLLYGDGSDYIHIDHALSVERSFALDYKKTIFRGIELYDYDNIAGYLYRQSPYIIDNPFTIFYTRPERYFDVDYGNINDDLSVMDIDGIRSELIQGIIDNITYTDNNSIYNIIIKLIHKEEIRDEDISSLPMLLERLENEVLFYAIPFLLFFIIEYGKDINKRMKDDRL